MLRAAPMRQESGMPRNLMSLLFAALAQDWGFACLIDGQWRLCDAGAWGGLGVTIEVACP